MVDDAKIARIISRVGDLPAMPKVVNDALKITDNPSAMMEDIGAVLEKDPGMAAKILRISNSAYYGMRQHVGTLKLALVILGLLEVRNIILGVSVFELLNGPGTGMEIAHSVWNACLRTGALAKMLSREMAEAVQGEEFVAGLLSDIGKLVLFREYGEKYRALLTDCSGQWRLVLQAEENLAGCTHADIAAGLAIRWNLPRSLSDALRCQYPGEGRALVDAADPELAAIVRLAKLTLHDDFSKQDGLDSLEDTELWLALSNLPRPIIESERRVLLCSMLE